MRCSVSGDRYALFVEPLSPELALVDPELAERARAQLVEGRSPEAARPRQPEPRPPRLPDRPKRRSRSKTTAIVAAIAVAALLGGAGAIWAGYDGNDSSVRESEQSTPRPQSETPPTTATSGHRSTTRSRPQASHGSAPRSPLRPPPRPPAFHVAGAPREPLGEITLPARTRRLEAWLTPSRSFTTANLRHWLYQHAWIVTGAKFGWWHGAQALQTLIRVDQRVQRQWGIGAKSEAVARATLSQVSRKSR